MSNLSATEIVWIDKGKKCGASLTLLSYCTGRYMMQGEPYTHPKSIDEFSQCRLLLEVMPNLKSCLPRVASASLEWSEFVLFWDDLCIIHDLENPDWRISANPTPKTVKMLNSILNRERT
jgi:hypothetical protein